MLKIASLGSGSSGNATLICDGDTRILLDCGFGLKETQRRLEILGLKGEDITAIVVTHEHSDHMKGVAYLSRKYAMPVFMTEGTFRSKDLSGLQNLHFIHDYEAFNIGAIRVKPIAVPHDAREPAQFVFECNGLKLGVLTDLGMVTTHVREHYQGCDGLLVEANHDLNMLANGPYPASLRNRVSSNWGHLNNEQVLAFLNQLDLEQLQFLVVGHISQKNNSVDKVTQVLAPISSKCQRIVLASQDEGFGWLELQQDKIAVKNYAVER